MFQDSDGNIDEYGVEKYKIDLEYIENRYYNEDEITREEKLLLMLKEEKRKEKLEYAKEFGYTSGINKEIEKTAKNMLNKNMDISIISEITGLSKEEINELKEN